MKSLLNEDGYTEIKERLLQLNENSTRQWGKMSVAQMCWHCQYPLKLAVDNRPNTSKGNWFVKTFLKKSLYNDKLWHKGLPTAPQLKAKGEKNFDVEYKLIHQLVDDFHKTKTRNE